MYSENNQKVHSVIVSPEISKASVKALKSMGISVYFSCESPNVSEKLKFHADMQLACAGKGKFVCAPECIEYYLKLFKNFNSEIMVGNTVLSSNYPGDIAYNIIVAEKIAIHNFKHTDPVIKELIRGKKLINVSQGYTACTLCMINETAFITSDAGILKALKQDGADVLFIDDSHIALRGFDHGFFGGASVMLSRNLLAVNGDLRKLADFESIIRFCNEHNVDVCSLSDGEVTDIGSIIPVA